MFTSGMMILRSVLYKEFLGFLFLAYQHLGVILIIA
ncbi:hypothetical protein ABIC59_003809 [Priestia aryabhattai]